MSDQQVDVFSTGQTNSDFGNFNEYDQPETRDPPIDPSNINAGNTNQFIDDQGNGLDSGELIGPGVPGLGGSEFEAKIEALYQVYGPEMANAALQQDITNAMLAEAKHLINEMESQGVISEEDAQVMREHVDMAIQENENMPVTDAEGNILFEDLNGNGRFDEGSESPLMISQEARTDVENWVGEDVNAMASIIGEQWRQELDDGNGGLFAGALGLPYDELGPNGQGTADSIGESGEDYSGNVFTMTDENGNTLVDENGEPQKFYLSDPVAPDDIREDVEQNGGELAGDSESTGGGSSSSESTDSESAIQDSMHAEDQNRDENQKDGTGKNGESGKGANNSGGDGNGDVNADAGSDGDVTTEGSDSGSDSVDGGNESAAEESGGGGSGEDNTIAGGGGGQTSSLSTNNWLVVLASAMGKTAGKHLKAMLDTGEKLGAVDSKEDPETFAQLNAEFSAESQIFKMFQEAISTSVKSIGEGMSSVARKS